MSIRYGFTTGSCAAAAAKAAAYMLLSGQEKKSISISTPKGILYTTDVILLERDEHRVSCGVIKDAGDDPDITHLARICASVEISEKCGSPENAGAAKHWKGKEQKQSEANCESRIIIDGGIGVGRVTRPGLDQPVGNAAINRVPREMITKEVHEVCDFFDYHGQVRVTIFVPEGKALAEKTFNPRLGIEGGISILGTSGIVEPMSTQALLETIRIELRQHREEGETRIAVSPGNYGQEFMRRTYGFDLDCCVKCSNFIGASIDMAADLGFEEMLLTGHIGKLVKLAGGIMNTHSREADCRMELLAAAAVRQSAPRECVMAVLESSTTEEAIGKIEELSLRNSVMEDIMEHIAFYLDKRAAGRIRMECMVYSNKFGELGSTPGSKTLLAQLLKDRGEENQ